jgi:superfamily II DNA or RNA helicase
VLIVAPTGSGKTVVAAHIMARAVESGRHVLFVAHRRELIDQCFRKLEDSGIGQVGVIMAGDPRRNPGASVQVASIDTLRHRAKPEANLVIVDEAHRALAKSYVELAAMYPAAVHLGLTATPYRADGRGLCDAYDALVVVASPKELIAEGFLVEPTVYTLAAHELPDLSAVKVKGGDYEEGALAKVVDRPALVGNVVEHWLRHSEGQRTVAFAVSIEHSKHMVERFQAAGVPAEHLDGETPNCTRAAILGRLETGRTRVVANVGVLCEGWDQPSVKCCVLARPTKSTGLYLQQAGRILRPWTDPTTGQPARAILIDHAGCVLEHGLPQADRELSLEGATKNRGLHSGEHEKQEETGLLGRPVPTEVEGELVELTRVALDERRAEWDLLCAKAKELGYKPGWAYYRYKERYGSAPPRSFSLPKSGTDKAATETEKRAYFDHLSTIARERGYHRGYVIVRYRDKFGAPPPAHFDNEAQYSEHVQWGPQ